MEQSEILEQIKQELLELESMPYGCECHGKTLCPNRHHFIYKIDKILGLVISLNSPEAINTAIYIQSIRNNQVRELNDKQIQYDFLHHGSSDAMESIVNHIFMHVHSIL